MKHGKAVKFWPRYHRLAWQNDGGPIPYAFRGRVKQHHKGQRPGLYAVNPLCRVGKWQWVVLAGEDTFVFTTDMMKRMYTVSPPDDR